MANELTVNNLTEEQEHLIRTIFAKDATPDELRFFLYQCKRTGLDPLSRQIYFIKRKGQGTIQTGIDGYRAIADRTGKYAGSDEPKFDEGMSEYEHIQSKRGFPTTATITVYKMIDGQRCGFTASARWDEYVPKDADFMWKKMPYLMLSKVAEALALRKAFPQDLSGLYVHEEMHQAGGELIVIDGDNEKPAEERPSAEPTTDEELASLCKEFISNKIAEKVEFYKTHPKPADEVAVKMLKLMDWQLNKIAVHPAELTKENTKEANDKRLAFLYSIFDVTTSKDLSVEEIGGVLQWTGIFKPQGAKEYKTTMQTTTAIIQMQAILKQYNERKEQ